MTISIFPACEHCGKTLRADRVQNYFIYALWEARRGIFIPAKSLKHSFIIHDTSGNEKHELSYCSKTEADYHRLMDYYLIEIDASNPSQIINCWDDRGHMVSVPFWQTDKPIMTFH